MKFFNTAGPVNAEMHYFVPHRFDEEEVQQLIEQHKYFILHAPRQSGKTTCIMDFVRQLNAEGKFKALYINVEPAQAVRDDIERGMSVILHEFKRWAKQFLLNEVELFNVIERELTQPSGSSLGNLLQAWAQTSDKPIILFIDEIDSLSGDTLISVLRQLRSGYAGRPKFFPQALCLVGVRDVRDYQIWSSNEKQMIMGGSAFNIKAESLTLKNFTLEQVRDLYQQHTRETGQQFTDEAIEYAFEQTQGQPWLVNALAYEACFRMIKDRSKTITKEILEQAKEHLIARCDTHLDVLIDRLQEPRVRVIIDAIVSGSDVIENFKKDDVQYARDLGLIKPKTFEIANPIYQEIIPRELVLIRQEQIRQEAAWYKRENGSLDFKELLRAFTQFYRENSAFWLKEEDFREAGPHLILLAFLQRVINGGGKIHREYALGRKRVDISIQWPYGNKQMQRVVIEVKIHRGGKTLAEGLVQTADYMDVVGADEGHLVVIDVISQKNWEEKIYHKQESCAGKTINVWGM